jgi:hypothetical protein
LWKLERIAGMNTRQLLEVATMVFVNQDQEARWEAKRKMKRKWTSLQLPLLDSHVGPGKLIQAEAEAIPKDNDKCSQDTPILERN